MANPIDIIVSRDAVKGLEELLNKLTATHEEMLRVSASAQTFDREIKNISTPKDLKNFIDSNIALTATIDKQTVASVKLQTQLEKESTTRRRIALDNEKLSLSEQKLIEQKKKLEQQIEKETQKVAFAQTLYQKTQNQINNLTKSYNDLSTRKIRYNDLSDAEEKRLNTLSSTISKYGNILKGVDATIGKHQRNVGNYAMQNSALSGSISQLTREMPAFEISAQTGFMAISNNLPIFFDAISNTIKQIKALRAEGQQVPGILKQLVTSFFSMGTALSIGVTLLTLFGDDLFKLAKEAFSTSKAFNGVAEAQKKIAEASKDGTKNASEELVAMRANLAIAKNVNLSYKDRSIAVDNLIKQYPYYFEGLSKEQIMAGNTAKAETALTNALVARARAQAVMSRITENESKRLSLIQKQAQLEKELIKAEGDKEKAIKKVVAVQYSKSDYDAFNVVSKISDVSSLKKAISGVIAEIKSFDSENKALTDYAISNQEKAIGLTYSQTKNSNNNKAFKADIADGLASIFKQKKAFLDREIEMYSNVANSESNTLDERLKFFKIHTEKKTELEILQHNENKRLLNLSLLNEKTELNKSLKDFVTQKNVTQKQKIEAEKLHNKAIYVLNEKSKTDLGILEINHSNNIVEINKNNFERVKNEIYSKLEFDKAIKEEELNNAIKHKNNLANINKKTNEEDIKKIDNIKEKDDSIFKKKLINDEINLIKEKISITKSSSEEEFKLKIDLFSKQKELNDLEIVELDKKKKKQEELANTLKEVYKGFFDDFAKGTGFGKMLDILNGGLKKFEGNSKATALVVADAFQEAFNTLNNMSNQYFQEEYTRLDKQKELAISNAGESAEAKAGIEKQYEEKKKEIRIREAKAKKEQAIVNVIIDTAQAVVASLPNFALAAMVGALGSVQIAMIASQPIPQYFKGTDHHQGGLMLVNDAKGVNYKETIITPDGQVMQPSERNVLMNAPKGTKVYTPEQWEQKQLTDMLHANGIIYSNRLTEGINMTFHNNNDKLVSEIQDLRSVIQNKESFTIIKDRKGERVYKREANHTKELVNSRINIKGYNV